MKKQNILIAGMGLVVGLAIGVLAASVIFTNDKNLATSTVKQVEILQNNILDQHFIEQMIPHHEDAVTMANLALEKAKKPEIKTLAANII